MGLLSNDIDQTLVTVGDIYDIKVTVNLSNHTDWEMATELRLWRDSVIHKVDPGFVVSNQNIKARIEQEIYEQISALDIIKVCRYQRYAYIKKAIRTHLSVPNLRSLVWHCGYGISHGPSWLEYRWIAVNLYMKSGGIEKLFIDVKLARKDGYNSPF